MAPKNKPTTTKVTAKKGDSFTDSAGRTGTVGFDTKTGKALKDGGSTKINITSGTSEKLTRASSVINNQKNIVQSTTNLSSADNKNGAKLDETVKLYSGQSKATGVYGTPVTDGAGNVIGKEMFDTQTGEPLKDPNAVGKNVTTDVAGDIEDKNGGKYSMSAPEGFDYQLPTPADGGKYVYDKSGKAYLQDKTGKVVSDPTADAEYNKIKTANTEIKQREDMYESYKVGLDEAHVALIDGIKQQASMLKAKTEELNKRTLGLKKVMGYRTGSTEYTPEIGAGILKAEEEEGMARIDEIDANMRIAIAQATSAKLDKDFGLLESRMNTIDALKKAKNESIQTIYKAYADNVKAINDQIKYLATEERAKKDQAIQEINVSAPAYTSVYDSLKTSKEKELFLEKLSEKTGLDQAILMGALDTARLEAKDKNSLIANRGKSGSGGADTLDYTDAELKKLRAVGIDPSDTKKADAYLYRGIDPSEYEDSLPQLDATKLNFNFGLNLADEADKIAKINVALKQGYSIEEIGKYMGFDKQTIEGLKKGIVVEESI